MDLLEIIKGCSTEEEIDKIITEAIQEADKNSTKVEQLGFLNYGKANSLFKGFIPFKTRIKYENVAVETYSMETTDFFYEFAHLVKRSNINGKMALILAIEAFVNQYFGYPGRQTRDAVFYFKATKNTVTDDEFFEALENNKIGDLKHEGAAQCTERSALAQQLLSLFGIETYYCMGCALVNGHQEGHCFNIAKSKTNYVLIDYSMPVEVYKPDGSFRAYLPFLGAIPNEEFEAFANDGKLISFSEYEYINGNQKNVLDSSRSYVVGQFKIELDEQKGMKV